MFGYIFDILIWMLFSGIVDQHIDFAEPVNRLFDNIPAEFRIAEIAFSPKNVIKLNFVGSRPGR